MRRGNDFADPAVSGRENPDEVTRPVDNGTPAVSRQRTGIGVNPRPGRGAVRRIDRPASWLIDTGTVSSLIESDDIKLLRALVRPADTEDKPPDPSGRSSTRSTCTGCGRGKAARIDPVSSRVRRRGWSSATCRFVTMKPLSRTVPVAIMFGVLMPTMRLFHSHTGCGASHPSAACDACITCGANSSKSTVHRACAARYGWAGFGNCFIRLSCGAPKMTARRQSAALRPSGARWDFHPSGRSAYAPASMSVPP